MISVEVPIVEISKYSIPKGEGPTLETVNRARTEQCLSALIEEAERKDVENAWASLKCLILSKWWPWSVVCEAAFEETTEAEVWQ